MTSLRNLLVIGTNYLVDNNLINLDSSKDLGEPSGHAFTEISGKKSVIIWQGINCEEIKISVWWDYDHENHPQANKTGSSREGFQTSRPLAKSQHYPKFIGAMVSGWLERKTSKHLQGEKNEGLVDTYIRRTNKIELEGLPKTDGKGFKASGKFYR
ncbi:hypothetical protein [Pantoea ananatis]|uniref:hypothetical protein n=1 Tax=Pantoea ananas TaxID=553 RepID=UPI000E23442D|nr:hypothetical protein [Pantoea ananatis]REE77901.1 hypothetical protein C7424_0922 [Pantoea ananatis]BBL31219.1 hypothetical protein PAFU01_26670 [Pantoea ananatis]